MAGGNSGGTLHSHPTSAVTIFLRLNTVGQVEPAPASLYASYGPLWSRSCSLGLRPGPSEVESCPLINDISSIHILQLGAEKNIPNHRMSLPTPSERAEYLIKSLEDHGQGDYIGESINQLEHSLQAAHQAQKSGTFTPIILKG